MCGIAGLICLTQSCGTDHARIVSRMVDLQVHRGPDDRGTDGAGRAMLGSNRLSIIDLSAAGHMPMHDPRTGRWIAYNGEIYNFMALREELAGRGYEFRSRTDTEVVLKAFQEWGDDAFGRFVGMFAVAIYDSKADTLTLARDRYGKKPVYYTEQGHHFLFASELKALVSVQKERAVNWQRLMEWSLYRNVDFGPRETLFAGLHALPAGHLMQVVGGRVMPPRCFYALGTQVNQAAYDRFGAMSSGDVAAQLEALVIQGVEDRLISDVPVGTLCSGGVDSSFITAVAARTRKDLLAFNVAVTGSGAIDESVYARQVTDSLGIQLKTLKADGKTFRGALVRAIYHSDYPLTHPNSVFFLLISEFARSHGVKVLLSGEAADELFGGYEHRYRRIIHYQRLQQLIRRLPGKLRRVLAAAGYAAENVPMTEFTGYEGLMAQTTSFIDRFARQELKLASERAYSFVGNDMDRRVLSGMLSDLTNFLAPLLRRLDRMSMAASVECRVPFLDHRVVDQAVNLPLKYRLRGRTDKWILKEIAGRHLPRGIVHRKKLGFPLPLGDYLAPLAGRELFEDGFCIHQLGISRAGLNQVIDNWRDQTDAFFSMLSLEIWGRLFFMDESVEKLSARVTQLAGDTPDAN